MLNFRANSNIRTVVQRMASYQRRYISASYPLITDDNMFNRRREMECLSNVLSSTPQISVIIGPVDSGKSRLVNRVILDLPKKTQQTIPIQLLNLRKLLLNSVESLAKHLDDDKWVRITKNSVKFGDWEPSYKEQQAASNITQIQHPIFAIDQAHELKRLLRDKDGHAILEHLFDKFVSNTKEQHGIIPHQNSHVVLISSDSFFDQWVEKFVGSSRYSVYVVGHLDKEEAEIYWKENVLTENSHWLKNTNAAPEFEKVFEVCGGSMYLMDMFFREYCQEPSNGPVHSDARNFHVVLQEERRLMKALLDADKSFEECPKWTKYKLRKLMKMLTTSTGILDYDKVCETLGKDAVDSMIKHNIIHLRPTCRLSYDVPDHTSPIVTAVSPAALVAMKKVLAKELISLFC